MIPAIALAGAAAGLGLLKGEFIDKPNEEKDRILQATTDRYSPWTGMRGRNVERSNPLGEAIAAGTQGMALGQNMEHAEAENKLNNVLSEKFMRQIETPAERAAGA